MTRILSLPGFGPVTQSAGPIFVYTAVSRVRRSLHLLFFHGFLRSVMMVVMYVVDHMVVVMHGGLHRLFLGLCRILGEGRSGHQARHRCGS
jgi:hypothetical protein